MTVIVWVQYPVHKSKSSVTMLRHVSGVHLCGRVLLQGITLLMMYCVWTSDGDTTTDMCRMMMNRYLVLV